MNSLRNAELVLLFLAALFGLSLAWKSAARDAGIDFYQFWAVGQALDRAGAAGVYSGEGRARLGAEALEAARRTEDRRLVSAAEYRRELETYSTPFLYASFRLFSTGGYAADFRNYRVLLLGCLTMAVIVLARLAGHSWNTTLAALAIIPPWFTPFTSEMGVGNVNSIQLAFLAVYLSIATRARWHHRDAAGGAVLGLAIAFKPNLVFVAGALAAHWILTRRTGRLVHHAAGAAAGAFAATVIAAVSFGSFRCWTEWLAAIGSLPAEIITVDLGNFSPSRLLGESLGFDATVPLGLLAAGAVVAAIWMQRRQALKHGAPARPAGVATEGLVLSAGCLLVVLAARLAWLHYYLFTIPAILFLLRPIGETRAARGTIVWRRLVPALALLGLSTNALLNAGVAPSAQAGGILMAVSAVLVFAGVLRELAFVRAGDR